MLAALSTVPIPITLAGTTCQARPLRVKDLADLDRFIEAILLDRTPHDDGLRQLRAEAIAAGRDFDPSIADLVGLTTIMEDRHGRALLTLLTLRRTPGIDAEEARALADAMTVDDMRRLDAVAFGLEPGPARDHSRRVLQALGIRPYARVVDTLPRRGGSSALMGAVLDVVRLRGQTFASVGRMTLPLLRFTHDAIRPAGSPSVFAWTSEELARTLPTLDPFGPGFMGGDGASAGQTAATEPEGGAAR